MKYQQKVKECVGDYLTININSKECKENNYNKYTVVNDIALQWCMPRVEVMDCWNQYVKEKIEELKNAISIDNNSRKLIEKLEGMYISSFEELNHALYS